MKSTNTGCNNKYMTKFFNIVSKIIDFSTKAYSKIAFPKITQNT